MKKVLVVTLLVVAMVMPLFAAGAKEAATTKIGISIPSADHGWTGGIVWWAEKAVNDVKAEMPGRFDFRVVTADNPSAQVRNVEDMMVWGMDYLVILPHESAPLTPIVKEVHSKGIRVMVVDRGLTDTSFGYVNLAGDNTALGHLSGEWLRDTMKAEGLRNYVAMGGLPVEIDTERMTAFFAAMNKEPSLVNLLGKDRYEFANWSTQKGLELMETFLQQYPKIDAVFCQDDDVLTGVLQAIKESGRSDIKIALGGAGSKVVYKMIIDGDPLVRATGTYHPSMIADGIHYIVDVATGKKSDDFHNKKEPTSMVIPSVMVTKANVMDHYEPGSIF
ncbi:MAG: substrate-binding domain-containing protein [Sphaerochaetaceae bacterium]|jgi:ribose transport system substrate-binding protein|nr:substrate-binding domain-containing protein [Sphaerochaetaceae bacterium]HHU87786.1 substrate-binding domain-containing protein [Spirochaetales bacterium]